MSSKTLLLMGLVMVTLLSWGAREANQMRMNRIKGSGMEDLAWFSAEPDGLYHARRVEQSLIDGLPIAAFDNAMNAPVGAAIPWPPYYDAILHLCLRPFAPADDLERKQFVEQTTATLPLVFGVLTTLVIALIASILSGWRAAWIAGSLHALAHGSIHYSSPGIADHHAFVALLVTLMIGIIAIGIKRASSSDWKGLEIYGVAGGILAGLLLGTWTASLISILIIQLYVVFLYWTEKAHRTSISMFAASFHLAATVAVMPAVAQSPWQQIQPWVVVNLSWFHPLWLALGATYFTFLYFAKDSAKQFIRINLITLGLGFCFLVFNWPPVSGIREGFEWASRANIFMADIAESQPPWKESSLGAFKWMGFGILLLPIVVWQFFKAKQAQHFQLLLLSAIVFVIMALMQLRFSDLASVPVSILLGCWLATVLKERIKNCPPRIIAGVGLILMLQAPSLYSLSDRLVHRQEDQSSHEIWRQNGVRDLHEWLGRNAPKDSIVLAHWDQGHALEFVANCRSVATNFGSYVGEKSFVAPASFFTSSNWLDAHEVLDQHRVSYVFTHSALPSAWPQLTSAAATNTATWNSSIAAALTHSGGPEADERLRLVYASKFPDPEPDQRLGEIAPTGMIWEVVNGAKLKISAQPSSVVSLEMRIDFKDNPYAFLYQREVIANRDGVAELTVPYSAGPNNCSAKWATLVSNGEKRRIQIEESAVTQGNTLTL